MGAYGDYIKAARESGDPAAFVRQNVSPVEATAALGHLAVPTEQVHNVAPLNSKLKNYVAPTGTVNKASQYYQAGEQARTNGTNKYGKGGSALADAAIDHSKPATGFGTGNFAGTGWKQNNVERAIRDLYGSDYQARIVEDIMAGRSKDETLSEASDDPAFVDFVLNYYDPIKTEYDNKNPNWSTIDYSSYGEPNRAPK